jgi:multidrug resistance efflux pump
MNHAVRKPMMSLKNSSFWQRLSGAVNDAEFYTAWLDMQCSMIGCVQKGAIFMADENGAFSVIATYPADFSPGDDVVTLAERAGKERKGIVRKITSREKLIHESSLQLAYPVREESAVKIVVTMELSAQLSVATENAMRQLQWGSAWLLQRLQVSRFRLQEKATNTTNTRLQSVLELVAAAVEQEDHKGAALSVITELADRLGCDRVSIGFIEKKRARLCAISHSSQFGKRMNLSRSLEELMDECLDQGGTILYPQVSVEDNIVVYRHAEYSRQKSVCLLTVPFMSPEIFPEGAFVFERAGQQDFQPDEVIQCESVAALVGPIIAEKKRNDRPIREKILKSGRDTIAGMLSPGAVLAKVSIACLFLVVLFFSFVKGDYRVAANMTLEGTVQRVVIAPFDGFLDEALPRAGDIVKKDQVLARLDNRDLVLERLKWNSQRQQYILEYHKAIAENRVAGSKIIQEQMQQAGAQISLLDEQIRRATIRAPFDGLIIRGDLSQTIGIPLERGQILFEVAPLDSYRIMLEVHEKDIDQIHGGQRGYFIVNALPGNVFSFIVENVIPVSSAGGGENVFRVEGRLEQSSERLRPGMQGYAKIAIGERKLIWIWSHEVLNMVRIWLWSHLP